MQEVTFDALAKMAGIGVHSKIWQAAKDVCVSGKTRAQAAQKAGIGRAAVGVAVMRVESTRDDVLEMAELIARHEK
jgi:hypothetical protein